jgi:AcrR family transcriptional regulator
LGGLGAARAVLLGEGAVRIVGAGRSLRDDDLSKHDQNRAEKRERLIRAGLDAFTETGYENTTVSDVVRRASMTPSTFYNYYRDKEALLSEILDRIAADLLAGLSSIRRDADSVEDYIKLSCRKLFESMAQDKANTLLVKRNFSMMRSLLDHDSLQPVYESLRRDLDRAIERGVLGPIDADYAVGILRATALELGMSMLRRPKFNVEETVSFSTAMIAGGIEKISEQAKE